MCNIFTDIFTSLVYKLRFLHVTDLFSMDMSDCSWHPGQLSSMRHNSQYKVFFLRECTHALECNWYLYFK